MRLLSPKVKPTVINAPGHPSDQSLHWEAMVHNVQHRTTSVPARRFAAFALGVFITLIGFVTPAHAFRLQVFVGARFIGQVTTLLPAAGSPTSFVLLQPNFSVSIAISPKTQLTGKSAEANVEGLVRDDYAVVTAKRMAGRWVATRIAYDVDPIPPLRIVSGTVVKPTLDGRHVNVRLDTGGARWITIGRLARYRLDGRLMEPAPILAKGEVIQLVVNRMTVPWIALEVDVHSVF